MKLSLLVLVSSILAFWPESLLALAEKNDDDDIKFEFFIYEVTAEGLKKEALEENDKNSQYNLGFGYLTGKYGLEINTEKAQEFLLMAARQAHFEAIKILKGLTQGEHGYPVNEEIAQAWSDLLLELENYQEQLSNHPPEYHVTATINGEEKQINIKQLPHLELLERLVRDENNEAAKYALGLMYYSGTGVGKDLEKAFSLFKEAANQGDRDAKLILSLLYYHGQGTERNADMAFKLSKEVFYKLNEKTFEILRTLYFTGEVVPKDDMESLKYLRYGAVLGYPESQSKLAKIYYNGYDGPVNFQKAFYWMKKSAENGNAEAQRLVGSFYQKGRGVAKNSEKAWEWFIRSANSGDKIAQFFVGYEKLKVSKTGEEKEISIDLIKNSACQNYMEAQLLIGTLNFESLGLIFPLEERFTWLLLSEKNGSLPQELNEQIKKNKEEGVFSTLNREAIIASENFANNPEAFFNEVCH